jgi:hypothetical protein
MAEPDPAPTAPRTWRAMVDWCVGLLQRRTGEGLEAGTGASPSAAPAWGMPRPGIGPQILMRTCIIMSIWELRGED